MELQQIIQSQYFAALEMLKLVIVQCPEASWDAPGDTDPSWRKAYHALYYAHLYLQPNRQAFTAWEKHHDPDSGPAFSPAEILEYLAFVQAQVRVQLANLEPQASSGFDWLPFSKLELQFYNIRHIQQHAGELYERIGTRANIDLDWVSKTPDYLRTA